MIENKIKQRVYYLDSNDLEFCIRKQNYHDVYEFVDLKSSLMISIMKNGLSTSLVFDSKEKVDEFCELVQNKKNEIWK